jgi:hypothetical protein
MTKFLTNKKILFITTTYFGYEREIIKSMKDYGAKLQVYYDDPIDYAKTSYIKSWMSRQTLSKINNFYRSFILRKTAGLKFDYIIILKGAIMTDAFMESLHTGHPEALFVQYQWDSLHNYNYERFIRHFDVNLTFDPADASRVPSLQYLPTFALDEFFEASRKGKKSRRDIDISFVGSNHSNRLKTLRSLRQRLDKHKLTCKFYVYLPLLVSLKSVLISRKMKPEEFMWGPLSRKGYKALLSRSRFVLDLPSPTQTGTPLRTYEALASGCRVITTNKNIAQEPFFNARYVHIIDPDTLKDSIPNLLKQDTVSEEFLSFEEYSLSSWTKKFFSLASKEHGAKTKQAESHNA